VVRTRGVPESYGRALQAAVWSLDRDLPAGRLILRQGLSPVAIGIAIGLAGTFALSGFLGALLFRVTPRDPLTACV
jgi:hypothetical protein